MTSQRGSHRKLHSSFAVQLLLSGGMTYSIVVCAAIGTYRAEDIIPLLLFTGHYFATAVVWLLISRSLPRNGSTCHIIIWRYRGSPRRKVNILGGHSIGHSKQENCTCTCVQFRTVSEIELLQCTVHCTLYTVQTGSTPCPHTSCKVHWCWWWNCRKCICIIPGKLYQLFHLKNKYRY
jgi:hypothetical protein